MSTSLTSTAKEAELLDQKLRALAARLAGFTFREIGPRLTSKSHPNGVSHVRAYNVVREALLEIETVTAEKAIELRTMELLRLDAMWLKLWPTKRGKLDPRTVDTLLRISERRAALLGLDAPKTFIPLVPPPHVGDFDLQRLSVEDLEKLEDITVRAVAPRLLAAGDDAPPAG